MSRQCCSRCGKYLHEGSLKYIVRINVFADFDGYLCDEDKSSAEDLQSLIRQIKDKTPETLENDIYQEMAFLLCKSCRNIFIKNPLNLSQQCGAPKGKLSDLLH